MAINDNNNPENNNTPTSGGSGSGSSNDPNKRRRNRNKPRRDGKGSNTQKSSRINDSATTDKLDKGNSKKQSRRVGSALAAQTPDLVKDEPISAHDSAAEDAAAQAEGGIKAVGNQRIIPFMKIEKPMALLSLFMVIASIIAIAVNGLNLGLDFTGGVSADVRYEQPVEQIDVVQALASNGFDDAVVQYLGTREELLVRLPPQSDNIDGLSTSLTQA
ncbi:protein translocase subunit SecF, partial [Psychrobacter sp. T6-1]